MLVNKKDKALLVVAREIENCRVCKKDKIGMAVPGEGNGNAQIVFLGEAPGRTEAKTGRPFIGASGKLLRQLITDCGLSQKDVFITSPVKYLPKYVTPTPDDVDHGRIHLEKQLAIIKPKVIVLLGRIAALAMLQENILVSKHHGEVLKRKNYTFLFSYHPAAALYSPKLKVELIKDFKKIKKLLK